jgi:glyoxylase-like metal-dependent hydrolase (beta-lactamase superfamily II)
VHLDHSGSCGKLAQWFPTARVIVHPKGEFHLTDPSKLVKSAGELFGDDLIRTFGLPEPIERRQVSTIANSEVISLGDGITLRAIWTPGHAPHHLSYLQEDAGVLFTGDAIGVQHPQFPLLVPTTPPPSFDLKQAIESIEHLDQFRIKRLATPHFGFKENAREQFRRNIEVLKKWEAQIKFLVEKKMGEQDILHELEKSIAREARQSLPDYLQLTLRLNVLGFTRYLKMHVE